MVCDSRGWCHLRGKTWQVTANSWQTIFKGTMTSKIELHSVFVLMHHLIASMKLFPMQKCFAIHMQPLRTEIFPSHKVLHVPLVEKHFCRIKIILFHWDLLLATLFLLSLGRDELDQCNSNVLHWSSSCSASSHVPCAPHRTTLFFITCFTPSLIGKQEVFMRPWWVLTVGKPYDKRPYRNSEP